MFTIEKSLLIHAQFSVRESTPCQVFIYSLKKKKILKLFVD